MQISKK